ncbi:hypothetical protein [Euzebya sp.]|uniref:DUF7669 domain-containing protein n=1 Tax=Euzebya sp. TaxID=1971409 RepID=UPI003512207C
MTAREEVLRAARALHGRGRAVFSIGEVVQMARDQGAVSADVTLRTHVVSYMCANTDTEQGGRWPDLVRVDRGQYRLNDPTLGAAPPRNDPPPTVAPADTADRGRAWDWEGNVQAVLVQHLRGDGWTVISAADTESGQQGVDVHARRSGQDLFIEVKGFPSSTYVRGPKRGEPKPTRPAVQARHWYAGALLSAVLLRDAHPDARVGMCFPDAQTYRRLVARSRRSLGDLAIEVWWVGEDGGVSSGLD